MKWKFLLVVFVIIFGFAFAATFFASNNFSSKIKESVTKVDLNPVSIVRNIPVFSKNISFSSEISNIEINPQNVEVLKTYLSEIGFFAEKGVTLRKENQVVTVKNLKIVLTDKKYNFNNFTEESLGGHLRSTEETFQNGTLTLFVGMNKNQYFAASSQLQNAALGFTSQILLATFSLAKPKEFSKMQTLSIEETPLTMKIAFESFQKKPLIIFSISN